MLVGHQRAIDQADVTLGVASGAHVVPQGFAQALGVGDTAHAQLLTFVGVEHRGDGQVEAVLGG